MGNLAGLESLSLAENQLFTLPASIGGLKKLQSLDLWNNPLSALPDGIGDLERLHTLRLPLDRLPGEELDKLRLNLLKTQVTPFSGRIPAGR